MTSASRPLLFVHIPRTGGTSITDLLLRALAGLPTLTVPNFWGASIDRVPELDTYEFVAGHFGMDVRERFARPPRVFTFLRDPFERVASLYDFGRSREVEGLPKTAQRLLPILRESSLEEFVLHEDPEIRRVVQNSQTWQLADGHFTEPYRPPDARSLELAKHHLDDSDFVGIFERLPQSVEALCRWLELPSAPALAHMNARPASADSSRDPEFRRRVREHLELDLELYEYALERAAQSS